jgi:hypothetical protein
VSEMENITQLSAEATVLLKTQVSAAEHEMERQQRFTEVHQAQEAQLKAIEKLRANFKAAIKMLDTTGDYLSAGQAHITSAKFGTDLSATLRESAAALHEAYFEYASRLCQRVHNCEKRMAAAALVHRNVDTSLLDLKSTKAIADDAGSSIRSLSTARDHLMERLDLATEKLTKHLNLHKTLRDAESQNHSAERPVQQRVRDLEVMLREDVIRGLGNHVNQESIFLDVARSRLEVATKMTQVMNKRNNNKSSANMSSNNNNNVNLGDTSQNESKVTSRRGSNVFAKRLSVADFISLSGNGDDDDDDEDQGNEHENIGEL